METNKQAEPTMEEILASIRRIISEDDPGAGHGATAAAAAMEGAAKDEGGNPDDVLELTEVVPEQPAAGAGDGTAPARTTQDEIDALMSGDAPAEPSPVEPSATEPPATEPSPAGPVPHAGEAGVGAGAPAAAPVRQADGAGLVSPEAAAASTAAFAGLAAALGGRDGPRGGTPIGAGAVTLEDLVRELLRPMLREWLDANLPGLVERLVRREIERIARRAEEE